MLPDVLLNIMGNRFIRLNINSLLLLLLRSLSLLSSLAHTQSGLLTTLTHSPLLPACRSKKKRPASALTRRVSSVKKSHALPKTSSQQRLEPHVFNANDIPSTLERQLPRFQPGERERGRERARERERERERENYTRGTHQDFKVK